MFTQALPLTTPAAAVWMANEEKEGSSGGGVVGHVAVNLEERGVDSEVNAAREIDAKLSKWDKSFLDV